MARKPAGVPPRPFSSGGLHAGLAGIDTGDCRQWVWIAAQGADWRAAFPLESTQRLCVFYALPKCYQSLLR